MITYTAAQRIAGKHALLPAKVMAIAADLAAERGAALPLVDELVEEIGVYGYHAGETKELAPSVKLVTLLSQLRVALDTP